MFTWPKLELTDFERLYVRPYAQTVTRKDGKKVNLPGVLKRPYARTMSNDITIANPSANIQVSRRSRLFALVFSGDISYTRIQLTNATGTMYTVPDPRTRLDPYVTALCASSMYILGSSIGGKPDFGDVTAIGDDIRLDTSQQVAPLLIEPNWTLMPNESFIINATFDTDSGTAVRVLNVAAHMWEFPGMSVADKATMEVL